MKRRHLVIIGQAVLLIGGRIVEWIVLLSLSALLLSAAYWLYMEASR